MERPSIKWIIQAGPPLTIRCVRAEQDKHVGDWEKLEKSWKDIRAETGDLSYKECLKKFKQDFNFIPVYPIGPTTDSRELPHVRTRLL